MKRGTPAAGGFGEKRKREEETVLIIEGARILDPAAGRDAVGDIVIEGERIREIGPGGLGREAVRQAGEENCRVIDGRGLAAAPGLVDVHVHFRDPGFTYKEDIETGARAAARGGFTTVVCMANTKPIADNRETLEYVLEKGRKTGIRVLSCAAISKGFQGKEGLDVRCYGYKRVD